jgi:hypothetical protein
MRTTRAAVDLDRRDDDEQGGSSTSPDEVSARLAGRGSRGAARSGDARSGDAVCVPASYAAGMSVGSLDARGTLR